MVRKLIDKVNGRLEIRLKRMFAPLSPDARVTVILSMLFIFGALCLWMIISSIFHFGKEKEESLKLEHIERLELEYSPKAGERDSLKQLNQLNYENEK